MSEINREIVGIVVESSDGYLLFGKGGVYKDLWLIPGGGIDEGEGREAAALRELVEETGIDGSAGELIFIRDSETGRSEKTLRDTGEKVIVNMQFIDFLLKMPLEKDDIKLGVEDDLKDLSWFHKSELEDKKFSPPTTSLLEMLGYIK
jgi:8-oxo-dGTP pyrophosphatase MutT (NUDIX family)